MASTIRRWSLGGRPILGCWGGSSGASRSHCASVSSRSVRAIATNTTKPINQQHSTHALAAGADAAWLHQRLQAACAALGTHVTVEVEGGAAGAAGAAARHPGGRLVVSWP